MHFYLVIPYLNYCSTVWENIGIGLGDKIQTGVTESGLPEFLLFLITRYALMSVPLDAAWLGKT